MKKCISSLLVMAVTGATIASPLPVGAQMDSMTSLNTVVSVPGGDQYVSIDVVDESIRTVLRDLSLQGGFNLLMDESVGGNITLSLNNVTINEALEAIGSMNGILIAKQPGNIYLAISKQAAEQKGLNRQLSKVIKIYYGNANRIANLLNQSIFAPDPNAAGGAGGLGAAGGGGAAGGAGGAANQKARADARTNSLIVVGTQREIELAEAAVAKLDVPRQSKTFYLSHANALDVATMLTSSIFHDGSGGLSLGGGGGGGGGAGGGAGGTLPSQLRVERQDVDEGEGVNTFDPSEGGVVSQEIQLRGYIKATDTASVSPEGPLVVPDSRTNSITIMGTAEQIALAESVIPRLDAQLPQVAIEASLIEITDEGVRELASQWGFDRNKVSFGFNNTTNTSNSASIGLPTVDPSDSNSFGRTGMVFSSDPTRLTNNLLFSLRSLVTNQKAKILSNPTVVATHDTESIIAITDEIVRRVTVQIDPAGFATQEVEIGEAGIALDILPKIGEDGTINMRLRPSVTTIREVTRDAAGNIITLLNKRDMFASNVRVRDGETLVIGGLIQESSNVRKDKFPGVGDLPIVGAMFRASLGENRRSELVLMITPHILNKTRLTPVTSVQTGMLTGGDQ